MTDFNTSDRDVTRAIRSWLHEDRHEDASRIAAAVLDQVEATPRRRPKWWPARRSSDMNTFAKLLVATAAVVVVAVVGINLLPRSGGGIGTSQPSARLRVALPVALAVALADRCPKSERRVRRHRALPARRDPRHHRRRRRRRWRDRVRHGRHDVQRRHPHRPAGVCRPGWRYLGLRRHDRADHGPRRACRRLVGGHRQGRLAPADRDLVLRRQAAGIDCEGWLARLDIANIGPENFNPVESGALVPPPDLAP